MNTSSKRAVATTVFAILLISGSNVSQAATNKANGPCAKVGASATIAGKKYVCAKNIMKKLTWMVPAATSAGTSKTPAPKPTINGGGRGGENEGGEGREGNQRVGGDDD